MQGEAQTCSDLSYVLKGLVWLLPWELIERGQTDRPSKRLGIHPVISYEGLDHSDDGENGQVWFASRYILKVMLKRYANSLAVEHERKRRVENYFPIMTWATKRLVIDLDREDCGKNKFFLRKIISLAIYIKLEVPIIYRGGNVKLIASIEVWSSLGQGHLNWRWKMFESSIQMSFKPGD